LLINNHLILEEYSFQKISDDTISNIAEFISSKIGDDRIKEKLVILHNDDFRDFVNLSTEVITRIKINNETGTVESGALFTEEYLPNETIFYSLALTTQIFNGQKSVFERDNQESEAEKVLTFFSEGLPKTIQIGGNATIGKGLVCTKVWEVKNGKEN